MAKSSGKSPSARELTDDVLDELVAEAEAGCDLSTAKLRPGPGRQSRDDVPFRKPGWDPLSNSFLNPARWGSATRQSTQHVESHFPPAGLNTCDLSSRIRLSERFYATS